MEKLLSRDQFRNVVFERDNHTCVFCKQPAVDAHHIIERRLWPDSGYYLNNGASVCQFHHLECEKTLISVEQVREACGITKPIIPPHLYQDCVYDKWGNIILPNKTRLKGELFFDESVQKILNLGDVLSSFVNYVKYPRTYHLPWSDGMNEDDRMMPSIIGFQNQEVVVTEKLDGENTSMYRDHIHARSIDSGNHNSRNWVKNFWSSISYEIPEGWRICGENLYAVHSLKYEPLYSYFFGFSVWTDKNVCLSWEETLEWFDLLGIIPVPVLYRGPFDKNKIESLWTPYDYDRKEGYVVRVAGEINYGQFREKVGKFVRANHVNTAKHWFHGQRIERNSLRRD